MEIAALVGGIIGTLLAILLFAVPILLLVWACIAIVKKMKGNKKE